MVIYLDVILIENLIINFFLLQTTFHCLNIKVTLKRIFFAALIGSTYTFTLIFNKLLFLSHMPWKLLIGFLLIYICLKNQSWKIIFKAYLVFLMSSMLLAGIFIFLQLNNYNSIIGIDTKVKFSVNLLIFSLMIIYIFTYRIFYGVRNKYDIKQLIYNVDIVTQGNIFSVKAFWDTGNEIKEPGSMLPVIVVEEKLLEGINISKYNTYKIPYKAFNGESSFLLGFKPKYISVHVGDKTLKKQAIIAFCDLKLSKDNDYNALLSREVI